MLEDALRARVSSLLEVASSRSIVRWRITAAPLADVVFAAPDERAELAGLRRTQLKIWLAPEAAKGALVQDGNLVLAPDELRVAHVLAALDMAALRVLDPTIYPHLSRGSDRAAKRSDDDARTRYGLLHWPTLRAPFATREYTEALAALSRRPMTVFELAAQSALSQQQAGDLIDELARRRVLKSVSKLPPPALPVTSGLRAVAQSGLLGKLRHWFQSRREIPAA